MKMTKFRLSFASFCLLVIFFSRTGLTTEINSSVWSGTGQGAHGENGSLIIGVNSKSKALSGYYESSDITGNIAAECKFYFEGRFESKNIAIVSVATAYPEFLKEKIEVIHGRIEFQRNSDKSTVVVFLNQIPQSCDWLYSGLPSYAPPKDFKLKDGLIHVFERNGNWQTIKVIQTQRAYFHKTPGRSTVGKAFVIAGDLIYVYDENKDWYYVKFQSRKKEIVGWIRKSDTIQFP